MKSTDRGRTWTSIAGDLPQRSGAWSIVQDHVNGNLLFAGMEFGVWFTVDGGAHWMQLKGGIPTTQARDLAIQRRENDLVVGTFGRGAFVLDDYTALRDLTPQALTEAGAAVPAARRLHVRRARPAGGGVGERGDAESAVRRALHLQRRPGAGRDAKLVLNIADDGGRQVRRLELSKESGVHRIAWNLRGDPPAQRDTTDAGGRGGRGGRGGGAGGDAGAGGDDQEQPAQLVGRGGQPQGPPAAPGRYRAVIAKVSGETVTPIGQPQTFTVVPLPR